MDSKRIFRVLGIAIVVIMLVTSCNSGQPSQSGGDGVVPFAIARTPQTPIAGSSIPQFVDPLPSLRTIIAGAKRINLDMSEIKTNILPSTMKLPGNKPYTGTYVWSYLEPSQFGKPASIPSYIGPVVVATRGIPTEIQFTNKLGKASTTKVLAYKNSTDQTLHWADPINAGANAGQMNEMPGQLPMAPWDQNYAGAIPATVHLHGGEVPPVLDGGPDSWFTSDGKFVGKGFYSKDGTSPSNYAVLTYPNTQQAGPLWFHDHTLGATRLNVYAGLAGAYLLVDPALQLPSNLPGPADIVPLVIQDRMFDTNGQLFFPGDALGGTQTSPNPEHPYWVPEFVGDTIVVNGKSWPYKTVDAKRYRFLVLNGSNARAYNLSLPGVPMWVIGNDGGYLDKPVQVNTLLVMPGERFEVIMDFAGVAGQTLTMTNDAATPFPFGGAVDPATTARIIQFRVNKMNPAVVDASYNPAAGTPLRSAAQQIVRLANPVSGVLAAGVVPAKTRALTLNEIISRPVTIGATAYPGGPTAVVLNNTSYDGMRTNPTTGMEEPIPGSTKDKLGNYVTETPSEGTTEVWELINLTVDSHPIHLHLSQFQILNRQAFDDVAYKAAYDALFPASVQVDPATGLPYPGGVWIEEFGPPLAYAPSAASGGKYGGNPDMTPFLLGAAIPPKPEEAGWKDTLLVPPGMVTRIVVRWAPTDKALNAANLTFPFDPAAMGAGYVWHCHIIDHEDNEMMRPDLLILPVPGAVRSFIQGKNY